MNIKVKEFMSCRGHSVNGRGIVNLTMVGKYSEMVSSIKLLQMLSNDIMVKARVAGSKPMKLGMFKIKSLNFNGDGESVLRPAWTSA